jgi:hypothetical protein
LNVKIYRNAEVVYGDLRFCEGISILWECGVTVRDERDIIKKEAYGDHYISPTERKQVPNKHTQVSIRDTTNQYSELNTS